jgi:hypothetical protein
MTRRGGLAEHLRAGPGLRHVADARAVTDTANHPDIAILVQVTEALAKAGRIDIYGVVGAGAALRRGSG